MENFRLPSVLKTDENIAQNWKTFKQLYEIYMKASGLNKKDKETQAAILLNLVGEDGVELFNSFKISDDDKKDVTKVQEAFEGFCTPKVNEVYERYKFNRRIQKDGESFDSFLTDIKKLIQTCVYDTQEDSMLRDRIVLGILDTKLQEKLLGTEKLSSDKAIEMCRVAELTKVQAREVQNSGTQIDAVKYNGKCNKCGYNHEPGRCPAYGKTCNKCTKIQLRKRHIETQIYVGAFQYLGLKQISHDNRVNENNKTSEALKHLFIIARNLLCELETAINNTGKKLPIILSRSAMDKRLTFRNNKSDRNSVDEMDYKFAKVRFIEYLHGLQQILKNRLGKRHQNIMRKQKKNPQLKKKIAVNDANKAAVIPIVSSPVNSFRLPTHSKDTSNDSVSWAKKHPMHRNNGLKHRNRFGLGKHRRNRNHFQKAGLGPDEIKMFRQNNRKSLALAQTIQSSTTTTTSSTTVAPSS